MELFELKIKFQDALKEFESLKNAYKFDEKFKLLSHLESLESDPSFWQNPDKKLIKEKKQLSLVINKINQITKSIENIKVLFMLIEEDISFKDELETEILSLLSLIDSLSLEVLLNKAFDRENALIEIHSGAGGTEAQDWADMLFRMYKMFASKHGFTYEVLDLLSSDEAGIKSVTFAIKGDNAYGLLKGETGVHRLVRISPFDASKRRHTSFASVYVLPDIEEDVEINLNEKDLKIDTYRSSGAGGQHVNKTESAIRLTHIPTGIVVTCQSERSQIQNRERALQVLKLKLLKLKLDENKLKLDAIGGETKETSFGSQIRSYVFHPYSLVKDLRTGFEETNTEKVMNGFIDNFIDQYLKSKYNRS